MGVTIGVRADPETKIQDRSSCDSQIVKTRNEQRRRGEEKFGDCFWRRLEGGGGFKIGLLGRRGLERRDGCAERKERLGPCGRHCDKNTEATQPARPRTSQCGGGSQRVGGVSCGQARPPNLVETWDLLAALTNWVAFSSAKPHQNPPFAGGWPQLRHSAWLGSRRHCSLPRTTSSHNQASSNSDKYILAPKLKVHRRAKASTQRPRPDQGVTYAQFTSPGTCKSNDIPLTSAKQASGQSSRPAFVIGGIGIRTHNKLCGSLLENPNFETTSQTLGR